MCRLLAYAATKNMSLKEALSPEQLKGFLWMSTIHTDGWGAAHLIDAPGEEAPTPDSTVNLAATDDWPALSGAQPDSAAIVPTTSAPAAPSVTAADDPPEPSATHTATSVYHATEPVYLDPLFDAVASESARSAIFHLRLATPNIPRVIENQQPFSCDGITFSHNGTIRNAYGNILTATQWPVSQREFERTGGRSDSALFFALILKKQQESGSLVAAISAAIAELRLFYPDSSYNCCLQTDDRLYFAHAVGKGPMGKELGRIYTEHDFADHIADYLDVKYRPLPQGGVVVASSGFEQRAEDGWRELANNQLLVVNTRLGDYQVVPLLPGAAV